MTDRPDDDSNRAPGYIRGGAGFAIEPRRVVRLVLAVLMIGLVALIVVLTVQAAHQNSRDHRLSDHGVAVTVTVTSCVGTATGTGITVNGFTCRGSFEFNGHQYTDVIRGETGLKQRGDVVQGVTDPSSPSTLSSAAAVAAARPSWRVYITPAALTAALLLCLALAWLWSRRGSGDRRGVSRQQA